MAAEAGRAPPPAWLDAAFVQSALREQGGADADVLVESIEVQYALAAGDNYCSALFRVAARVRGEAAARALLVKALPVGGEWARLVGESRLFVKEAQVFAQVLPALQALLEAAAPARFPPFAARCLRYGHEPTPFIVLQDLRPEGYSMRDRLEGLDLPHARLALRALGRLHAASSVLLRRRPELFDGLISIFEDSGRETRSTYYPKSVARTANTLASWSDFPPRYAQKVQSVVDKIFPKLQEINRRRPGKFNVLIHGDFWTNNLLFRYEGEAVRDIRLVDFQLTHVGNPAIDLVLFRYTSLQETVFEAEWEALLGEYHAALCEALQLLGEAAPPLAALRADVREARAYAVLAACIWLPSVRLDQRKLNLDSVVASDDAVKDVHRAPTVCRWLRKLLPVLDEEGVFDDL